MFDPAIWLMLIAGGAVGYGLWTTAHPSWPIRLVVSRHGLQSHRGLPRRAIGRITGFFKYDVELDGKVVILAARQRGGQVRTRFRGEIDPGTQQQIRNFLNCEL